MKKFSIRAACFLLLQAVILIPLTFYGSQETANQSTYPYALKDKFERLQTQKSPRIIFVGGSNLAFGLNSEIVKQKTGRNPINLGLHGSAGLLPLLRMIRENLQEGDLIVLAPEYRMLSGEGRCTRKFAEEIYRVWPECRDYFQPDLKEPLEDSIKTTTPLLWLANCVHNSRKRFFAGNGPEEKIYLRSSFNQYGDHVAHYGVSAASVKSEFTGVNFDFDREDWMQSVHTLNEFGAFCQERNVQVYFSHCPTRKSEIDRHRQSVEAFESVFRENLQIPMLTSIEMMSFDRESFFDYEYHLTQSGAIRRTNVICRELSRQLMLDAARHAEELGTELR